MSRIKLSRLRSLSVKYSPRKITRVTIVVSLFYGINISSTYIRKYIIVATY